MWRYSNKFFKQITRIKLHSRCSPWIFTERWPLFLGKPLWSYWMTSVWHLQCNVFTVTEYFLLFTWWLKYMKLKVVKKVVICSNTWYYITLYCSVFIEHSCLKTKRQYYHNAMYIYIWYVYIHISSFLLRSYFNH